MRTPERRPPAYLRIPLPKGCLLLLTPQEYAKGLRRGKALKRRETWQGREARDFQDRGKGGLRHE
ncbi:MAG: hypothetical protein HY347_04500 [candidate division NC10 bacterium]|nr:hypothetical protein [candidate division NC10 bacterium]